ncbi:MAG: DegT/DnrJ/EryC1/StrS family aminotransferase [Bacillota bacterium]|nr:DegT/DnrJ/EryC1/StrS family aminotransferase [Bacillota bacterium]
MQFRDLGAQYQRLKPEIDRRVQEVMAGSKFIFGPEVKELEDKLADFVGVKHCVSCANGTDALQLLLMAWGVGEGDAVFTSDFTFFASAGSASILGATAILVDVDERTFNICPDSLEKAIEEVLKEGKLTPKVIVPVDLFGLPADYDRIQKIADKYGLLVMEDGAQGFGGAIRGQRVCSFGDAATTSFFPAKPLGCYGDGGAIFTNDDQMDVHLRSLRAQGRSPEDKYDNQLIGMNSRLDTLQAAILLPKFEAFVSYELDAVNEAARKYTEGLQDLVITPLIPEGYYSSWAQYTILLKDRAQRDMLKAKLVELKIPTMVYYPRGLHQQTAYADMGLGDDRFPVTTSLTGRVLSLPMHPYLSGEDINKVISGIRSIL